MALFAVNQELDTECKKVYDRVNKVAARQGETAWLKAVYHDDERFAGLMARFKETTKRDPKKNPFKICEYKETYESRAEVLQDDHGEMMDEEDFVVHVTTRRLVLVQRMCNGRVLRRAPARSTDLI